MLGCEQDTLWKTLCILFLLTSAQTQVLPCFFLHLQPF